MTFRTCCLSQRLDNYSLPGVLHDISLGMLNFYFFILKSILTMRTKDRAVYSVALSEMSLQKNE